MKTHSTNYYNTFIIVSDDCPIGKSEAPPIKTDQKTAANIHFDMISKKPYQYDSDEVVFEVFAHKNDLTAKEKPKAREAFYSKGQPCLRTSALGKRYGWGIHYNAEGKMAVYGIESKEYQAFSKDKNLKIIKAINNTRK
jgi:hypothetical protein